MTSHEMSCSQKRKPFKWRVGFWLSDKKLKKMNVEEMTIIAQAVDVDLVQINLLSDLETQGPFDAIFHKLSDFLVLTDQGDVEASLLINNFEKYLAAHPEIVVFDPFPCVRRLCDRYLQYSLIQDVCKTDNVYTPAFVDLVNKDEAENSNKLKAAGIKYPFVCKPFVAHGTDYAHQMSIIFCEEGLKNVQPPCVAQNFIRHNAILYKIYVIGDRYFVLPRPSLKNFRPGPFPTIFFDSHEVSKEGCTSSLSQLDEEDLKIKQPALRRDKLDAVVRDVRRKAEISLFGLDIVVEMETGCHYIIDVNNFPGYDGVDKFFEYLFDMIVDGVRANERRRLKASQTISNSIIVAASTSVICAPPLDGGLRSSSKCLSEHALADSGIGSCTESEDTASDSERKLLNALGRLGAVASTSTAAAAHGDAQQKLYGGAAGEGGVVMRGSPRLRGRRMDEKFATISTPTAAFVEHLQPNWNRIKRFYGIPKPPSTCSSNQNHNNKPPKLP